MTVEIEKLLNYLNGNPSIQQLDEIEKLLAENPVYFEILGGLALMKKELGCNDRVKAHLKEKKETITEKIISNTKLLHTA